jgi:uncharacterized protein with FMN-binding domain
MRRIVLWAMSTLTVLVLLFSYSTSRSSSAVLTAETRQVTTTSKTSGSTGSTSGSSSASSSDSSGQEPADDTTTDDGADAVAGGATTSSGSSGSGGTSSAATTYAGDAVMTRYGNVQVQITVQGGKITAAEVLQVPWNDRRDQMINSEAVPVYNDETVAAQSAQIDVVSGATYTWDGYTQSLQSAIDQAHL